MIESLITIYINTFKLALDLSSSFQDILFTDGASLWGWTPPYFFPPTV